MNINLPADHTCMAPACRPWAFSSGACGKKGVGVRQGGGKGGHSGESSEGSGGLAVGVWRSRCTGLRVCWGQSQGAGTQVLARKSGWLDPFLGVSWVHGGPRGGAAFCLGLGSDVGSVTTSARHW